MSDSFKPTGSNPLAGTGHISSRLVYDGRVVHLSVDRVRFPDGEEGELELIRHRGASAVVPLLGDASDVDPDVVLIHQYRRGGLGGLRPERVGRGDRLRRGGVHPTDLFLHDSGIHR